MDLSRISKLRQRGFLEAGPGGTECVRLSVQQRNLGENLSYDALKHQLQRWIEDLRRELSAYGGEVIPDSLSTSAQTVEALIPVETVGSVSEQLERQGVRLDFVEPRQIF